jgi:hypothetical protein
MRVAADGVVELPLTPLAAEEAVAGRGLERQNALFAGDEVEALRRVDAQRDLALLIAGRQRGRLGKARVGDPEAREEIERPVVKVRLLQLGGELLRPFQVRIAVTHPLRRLRGDDHGQEGTHDENDETLHSTHQPLRLIAESGEFSMGHPPARLPGCRVAGLSGCRVTGLRGCEVAGLLGCWVAGLLGC